MKNTERVTVREAAEILGISSQYLRDLMSKGVIDIGIVIRGKPNKHGARQNTYMIYRHKLDKFVGADL